MEQLEIDYALFQNNRFQEDLFSHNLVLKMNHIDEIASLFKQFSQNDK